MTLPEAPSAPTPIFLHSHLRSGSTWFWNRFRQAANTLAYYEPCNEALAAIGPNELAARQPEAWRSGHPTLDRPYYEEYAPLLRPHGGVAGFHADFAYRLYYQDAPHAELQAYVESLARHARQLGRLPVFGFCRSNGRAPWLRRHFGGCAILTRRNPRDQWLSCHTQLARWNNDYFELIPYLIAAVGRFASQHSRFFEGLPFPDLTTIGMAQRAGALRGYFQGLPEPVRRRVFLRVYMLDLLIALPVADVVVDLDRLCDDTAYRSEITWQLRGLTGIPDLSFEDCALPRQAGEPSGWQDLIDAECTFLDEYAACRMPPVLSWPAVEAVKTWLRQTCPVTA